MFDNRPALGDQLRVVSGPARVVTGVSQAGANFAILADYIFPETTFSGLEPTPFTATAPSIEFFRLQLPTNAVGDIRFDTTFVTTSVPVPAGLPLALGGLAMLGGLAARRRAKDLQSA